MLVPICKIRKRCVSFLFMGKLQITLFKLAIKFEFEMPWKVFHSILV